MVERNILEKRFNRNSSNDSRSTTTMILQKQLPENRRTDTVHKDVVPDLTDFMNDMFFGTPNSNNKKKAYNLTGRDSFVVIADENNNNKNNDDDFDSSRRFTDVNNKARLDDLFDSSRRRSGGFFDEFDYSSSRRRRTSVSSSNKSSAQNWLEEAKRIVAQSPPRKSHESSSSSSSLTGRGSPRFASVNNFSSAAAAPTGLDRRDPFSRSARRNKPVEGFSGEILSKTAKFTRNNSEINQDPPSSGDASPTSAVQKWFSDTLKPQNTPISNPNYPNVPTSEPTSPKSLIANENLSHFLPRQSTTPRKSRFQNSQIPAVTNPPPNSKRTFKNPANLTSSTSSAATNSPTRFDPQILSPPKNLVESSHRRSISSNTCSVPLSPPKNLVESVHRRSISASTCSSNGRILPKSNGNEEFHEEDKTNQDLNGYLNEQRTKVLKIMSGEMDATAKIVLSGPSNSTSSMVAAIGYAWLSMNRMKADYKDRSSGNGNEKLVVPVMNMRRGQMWNYRQAAWLFHHVRLDANALLFSDEVDLETLMMTKRLSMLVVGEDVLKTNGEVGSGCTVLADNYCEDAYDLLQTPMLKKLLLAGILLDTQNLNVYTKSSMTRDAEAIQLLLVGSSPNYRNTLFDELMQDQSDDSFTKVLQQNYGKPPTKSNKSKRSPAESSTPEVKAPNADKSSNDSKTGRTNTISPKSGIPTKAPAKAPAAAAKGADSSRGKNGFFLAKWFGFGSK